MRDANDPLERQRVLDSLFTERELKKMQRLEEKEQNQNNEDNPNLDQELKRKILSRYEAMMYEDEGVDEDYVASVYNPNEETLEANDDETDAMKRPASTRHDEPAVFRCFSPQNCSAFPPRSPRLSPLPALIEAEKSESAPF